MNEPPFRPAPADPTSPGLNPVERHAFRELARRLTERLNEPAGEPAAERPTAIGLTDAAVAVDLARAEHAVRDQAEPRAITPAERGASAAKSDVLAKISHEIRNSLNAIIGFAEVMLEERFGPIGNERYRQYLKDIHNSGADLLALVNDLLDLSEIDAGKLALAFDAVALDGL